MKCMTLSRRLIEKVAVCSGRISSNNYISVNSRDIESTDVEPGDELRVLLIRTDLDREFKPRDRDVFETTLQKSGQIYVPKNARQKLDLNPGDIVKYIIIPKDSFPGVSDGPLRDKIRDLMGINEQEPDTEPDRPTRETSTAEFEGPIQQTGQLTVPAGVMDKMGLVQGDNVLATVQWKGNNTSVMTDIGTANRITIPKSKRDEIGLEAGDTPTVRLGVF